jgi:hypothetical protein
MSNEARKQQDPSSDKGAELDRDKLFMQFSWLVARTKGDPHCKVPGCWGRGIIGLRRMEDMEGKVGWGPLYCGCGKKGASEFVLVEALISRVGDTILTQQKELSEKVLRGTFWGGIRWMLRIVPGWIKRGWNRFVLRRKQDKTGKPADVNLLGESAILNKVLN